MLRWFRRLLGEYAPERAAARPPRRRTPKLPLTQRIDHIVAHSRPRLAIHRLTGFRAQHYWHAYLRYTLGTLHLHHGDQLVAGSLLYFKVNKTPAELRAVNELRKRHGNDPAHLLRVLIGQYPRLPKDLRKEIKQELWVLAQAVRQREGMVPRSMRGWYAYLEREISAPKEE